MTKIGIIGGTGLCDPEILKDPEIISITTPWGPPSSKLLTGSINGVSIVNLSRHGKDHSIPPTQVNNRANIFALNKLECTHIITTTACGSLREEIGRGDLVFPDQFIDFTRHREVSFYEKFEEGNLHHTPMADPFSGEIRNALIESAVELKLSFHTSGTVITIEGPRFSTRAESKMFRAWGADIINMSIAPEVILANELGIPYGTVAISTDYDCWKTDEKPVLWEDVLEVFKANVNNVINLIIKTLPKIQE